jgi:hypothetical protein
MPMQFGGPACIQMQFDPAGTWVRVDLCWTVAVHVTITRNVYVSMTFGLMCCCIIKEKEASKSM